jgi:hypothetical protein
VAGDLLTEVLTPTIYRKVACCSTCGIPYLFATDSWLCVDGMTHTGLISNLELLRRFERHIAFPIHERRRKEFVKGLLADIRGRSEQFFRDRDATRKAEYEAKIAAKIEARSLEQAKKLEEAGVS